MINVLFFLSLIVITVIIATLWLDANYLSKEIDNVEEVIEHHRIKLKCLEERLDQLEKRLDQLEDVQTAERR